MCTMLQTDVRRDDRAAAFSRARNA